MGKSKMTKVYIVAIIAAVLIISLFFLRFYYQGKIGIFADYSNMYHLLSLNTEDGDFGLNSGVNLPVQDVSMKENVKFFGSCNIVSSGNSSKIECPDSAIALEDPSLPGYYSMYIKNPDNLDIGAIEVSVAEPQGYTCPTNMIQTKIKYCSEPGESIAIDEFCNQSDYVVADSVNPNLIIFDKDRLRNKNILLKIELNPCSKEVDNFEL